MVEEQDEVLGLRDRRLVWRRDEVLARMADEEEAIVEDMVTKCMLCYTCVVVAVSRTTLTHMNIIFGTFDPHQGLRLVEDALPI